MPTLRRILKYTPAVVLGLLIVAWFFSCFATFNSTWRTSDGRTDYVFAIYSGSIVFAQDWYSAALNLGPTPTLAEFELLKTDTPKELLGKFACVRVRPDPIFPDNYYLSLPLHTVIVALIPLGIGAMQNFRFGLWHYLAYTALVAVELAYYLRWQE